jgi:hypothetical protein
MILAELIDGQLFETNLNPALKTKTISAEGKNMRENYFDIFINSFF